MFHMEHEPLALILGVAIFVNALLTVIGGRMGLTEIEVGILTSGVTTLATAYARSKVTPF